MNIDKQRTAVLGLHWVWEFLSGEGAFGTLFSTEAKRTGVVANTASLMSVARSQGVPVIYTRVVFQPNDPHLVANNPLFQTVRDTGALVEGGPGSEIVAELAPRPDDTVITNDRVSGFINSSLDFVLRTRGIDTLLLTGVATNGTVESTARQAADLGYRAIVLADCTSADSEQTHEASLSSLRMLAEVGTADEAIDAISASADPRTSS